MYNLPDLFLQLGAEAFEYPMYEKRPNLRFTGPLMPRLRDSMKATVWLEELDGARPLIFVTQGTLANFDFNQLVNPALDGLAGEDVQVIVTAGGGVTSGIVKHANSILEMYLPYDLKPLMTERSTQSGRAA